MKLSPKMFRFFFNFYPPFLFSSTRVRYIAPDWREVRVELKRSLFNRNYVGTIFGGSLYQAADPFFMLMLIKNMGLKKYLIWDQAAEIIFIRPARSNITYHFKLSVEEIAKIEKELESKDVVHPVFTIRGLDKDGQACVEVRKTVYVRNKPKK